MTHMRWLLAMMALVTGVPCHSLETLYSWNRLDYNFSNESMKMSYIASVDFVQLDNLPMGVAMWHDKMFITVPQWKKGVPTNLNYIHMKRNEDQSPRLTPNPSWETNDVHSATNDVIISMLRVGVDACDRLWGLDDILGNVNHVRFPRIIVIDLKTD